MLAMKAVHDRIRFAFGKRPGCDWVLGRIVDYARSPQTFADWEHLAIARHLAICPDCAREFIEIQEGFTALAEMLHPDRDVVLSIDYEALARRAAVESDDRLARVQHALAWLGANKRLAAMARAYCCWWRGRCWRMSREPFGVVLAMPRNRPRQGSMWRCIEKRSWFRNCLGMR